MPKYTFDEFIANAVSLKRIHNSNMLSAICSYLTFRYKKTYDTKPHAATSSASRLSDVFKEISLEHLTIESLNSVEGIIDRWKCQKEVCRFLIFTCKNNLVTDPYISRLCDFEEYIENSSVTTCVPYYIMRDPNYDIYKSSDLYAQRADRIVRELYLFTLSSDILISSDAQKVLSNTVHEIKFSTELMPVSRLAILLNMNSALRIFTKGKVQNSITGASVLTFLDAINTAMSVSKRTHIMQGIFTAVESLCDSNVISDISLINAMLIRKQVNNFTYEHFRMIVTSEHPERWVVFRLSKYRNKNDNSIRYINAESEVIRSLIVEFLNFKSLTGNFISEFCSEFQQSIMPYSVRTIDDFSYQTFVAQTQYFFPKFDKRGNGLVTSFYLYIHQNYHVPLFEKDNISNIVLTRQHISQEISDGFRIINYNPIENYPVADKWLLCYKKSANDNTIRTRAIDFTTIKCKEHRNWIKSYIWSATPSIENRIHPFTIMRECCNRLYELKTGDLMSIFTGMNDEFSSVSVKESEAIRNWILSSFDNNRTRNGYVYNFRNLLRFIDDNNAGNIEAGVYYTFTHTLDNSYDNINPISDEELKAVSSVMKKNAENNTLYNIYYSVFYIALETSFRGSQLVELTKDCVVETAKKGEYVLYSGTKTSAGEYIEQPITTYVEREIREILQLTEEYRQNCTDTALANRLFIIPANKHGVYRALSLGHFNKYLRDCCVEAGIPEYTIANLRDTHMTKAEEYVIRNSLSEMHQSVLSGHKHSSTDDIHYVRFGIREMLEAVHGVIIGNVTVDGKILKETTADIAKVENEVSNGCGYCSSESCTNFSYLDCMLCKDFVTTVSRLPYFEEQLKIVDAKLPKSSLPHDKEDLVNIKILLLKYIEEILKLKETDTFGSE